MSLLCAQLFFFILIILLLLNIVFFFSFATSSGELKTVKSYQAADIFAVRDEKLFSAMCTWTNHCLHHSVAE